MSAVAALPFAGVTATPAPAAPPSAVPAAQAPGAGYPRPLLWTAKDFHWVGSTGIWEARRPVLIDGVVWELGRSSPRHSVGCGLAWEALRATCPADCHVRPRLPLDLSPTTDPMPDFAVVPGSYLSYAKAHPAKATFVVEVSDTSLSFDRTTKAEVYAAAGIPVYWVIDVDGRVVHEFRDPQPLPPGGTAYRVHVEHRDGDILAGPNGAPVAVADLLPTAG